MLRVVIDKASKETGEMKLTLTDRQRELLLDALASHEAVIDARDVEQVTELAGLIGSAKSVEVEA